MAGSEVDMKEGWVPERKEEEVKLAELEIHLREMVLEVLKPTVFRSVALQTEVEEVKLHFSEQDKVVRKILDEMAVVEEHTGSINTFREQLSGFGEHGRVLEARLEECRKNAMNRIESAEQAIELQRSAADRLGRNFEWFAQDMEHFNNGIKGLKESLHTHAQKNKEQIETEIRRVDRAMQEIKDVHSLFVTEVWGPEEPGEFSPPSLRRLDIQMRAARGDLTQALADLKELRRLDEDMTGVKKTLVTVDEHITDLSSRSVDLYKKIDKIALDAKNDNKRMSNLMAAFTANLMQDVRGGFSSEVKDLQQSQQSIERFVRETQASVAELELAVTSTGKQAEAAWRELRADLDCVDSKRKRDKEGFEDGIHFMQSKVTAALEGSEATIKGLEHVAQVLGMALQSERISVVLDAQDFVERQEAPYVGCHGVVDKRRRGPPRKGGLDPETLFRLTYQPQPMAFQGVKFERQQLLTLREKLSQAAQEVLAKGPGGSKLKLPLGSDLLAQAPATSVLNELPSGRRSVPLVARPGSRGQPSARGSPLPGEAAATLPEHASARARPNSPVGRDREPVDGPGPAATHLPVLAAGEKEIVDGTGSASTHLPTLAVGEKWARAARPLQNAEANLPLTAR